MSTLRLNARWVIPTCAAVTAMFLLRPPSAGACSDAGPPTLSCADAGQSWVSCETHEDCPSGTQCDFTGVCVCECTDGTECTDGGCRCAKEDIPQVPDGCWAEESAGGSLCLGHRYLRCFDEADCGDESSCWEAQTCNDDSECFDLCLDGERVPCVDGVCTCSSQSEDGCSASGALEPGTLLRWLMLLISLAFARRSGSARP